MSQTYRIKNTFVEHPGVDESRAALRRSNSWSASSSSQSLQTNDESSDSVHSRSGLPFRSDVPNSSAGRTIERALFVNDSDSSQSRQAASSEAEIEREEVDTELEQEVPSERQRVKQLPPKPKSNDPLVARHEARKCIPCVQLVITKSCSVGSTCTYCHLDHGGPLVQRPSKEIRKRCKQAVLKVEVRHEGNEEERIAAMQELLCHQNPFMRNYIVKILGNDEDGEERGASSSQAQARDPAASSSAVSNSEAVPSASHSGQTLSTRPAVPSASHSGQTLSTRPARAPPPPPPPPQQSDQSVAKALPSGASSSGQTLSTRPLPLIQPPQMMFATQGGNDGYPVGYRTPGYQACEPDRPGRKQKPTAKGSQQSGKGRDHNQKGGQLSL
eukprot:TRINITY_DN7355_c0_g1_i1.p1 TRINITY_DN7355_c0_g1~~TRINITY_DN7355_c0_g1_i1.p1  ORF type:complete len:393 (+),score=58.69 TRINITY_DN7355_c0_g1_i1:22-1179(+)